MAPFDSLKSTYNQSPIVSMAVPFWSYLTLKNIMTLKSRSGVTRRANLFTLKSTDLGSSVAAINIGLSSFTYAQRATKSCISKVVCYGRLRSCKVIKTGTN